MSKPIVVAIPAILLALDFWPLKRFKGHAFRDVLPRLKEKIPIFILAVFAAGLTVLCQYRFGAMAPPSGLTIGQRIVNAAICLPTYIRRMFWPSDLSIYYPYEGFDVPIWKVILLILLLIIPFAYAIVRRNRYPWLLVGLAWFAFSIAPVSGLIQIGSSAMADRYAYLSTIGILIAVVWHSAYWIEHASAQRPRLRFWFVKCMPIAMVVFYTVWSWTHVPVWRNSVTLFSQARRATPPNFMVERNLAEAYCWLGQPKLALPFFHSAAQMHDSIPLLNTYGKVASHCGEWKQAMDAFSASLSLDSEQPAIRELLQRVEQNLPRSKSPGVGTGDPIPGNAAGKVNADLRSRRLP